MAWLTTVDPKGRPQSSVVWFLWQDDELLVYSRPGKPKVSNVEGNPFVSLVLNSDERGNDMVSIEGMARIDPSYPPADRVPAYLDKYRGPIAGLGMTPESFARAYSVPILIRPTRARYW